MWRKPEGYKGSIMDVSQLMESVYADSVNLTGLWAVMTPYGERLQFTGSKEQARKFKRQLMRQYPGESFGLFEMKGSWEVFGEPKCTGYIEQALLEHAD
jgi:hypothetical protein